MPTQAPTGSIRPSFVHGDLRAIPRVAGGALNLDDLLGNFRHLELEELHQHLRIRAGQNELGAPGLGLDPLKKRAHAIADAESFPGNQLNLGEDGLGVVAQINDHHFPGHFFTVPLTSSPRRGVYSSTTFARSASRTR